MHDDHDTAADRARRRWRDDAARRASPPAEPGNVQEPSPDAWRRLYDAAPLHLRPLDNPRLLAFLGAAARAELQGASIHDLLVADRFDLTLMLAAARTRGLLDSEGRITAEGREYALGELSPLLPLLLHKPRGRDA